MGRRVQKTVYAYSSGTWQLQKELLFIYDGWNVIEEITRQDGSDTSRYFVWGLDLSQSLQGAGGVGGLLAIVDGDGSTYHYCFDANGNVSQLVNAANGEMAAHYEYGPFGNLSYSSGAYAESNPFKFSTKYFDQETNLYYYIYRYYSPGIGRWLGRDPAEAGLNPYAFIDNNVMNAFDYLGLWKKDWDEFMNDPRVKNNSAVQNGDTEVITAMYQEWLKRKYKQNGILDIFKNTDFSNAPPPSNASYWGAELNLWFVGGGVTEVSCCDKKKTKNTFIYEKECYGYGLGAGVILKGEIKGMEECNRQDYEGWFLEFGGSAGVLSAGIDLSFQNSTITLPFINKPAPNIFKLGKVYEAGIGGGVGAMGKVMFCWYTYKDKLPAEECGCEDEK